MDIQQNVKQADGTYTNIYPMSDASQVRRVAPVINYLDGNNLQEILQDTANIYINPNGNYWENKLTIDTNNVQVCGFNNFIFVVQNANNDGLNVTYSFDSGITWNNYIFSTIVDVEISQIIGIECIVNINYNNIGYDILITTQFNNGTSNSYLIKIYENQQNNTYIKIPLTQTGTISIIDNSIFLGSFILILNNGSICTLNIENTSWTTYNVSVPTTIQKIIFSKDFGKPFGILSNGNICYPQSPSIDSTWTTQILNDSQTWTNIDITYAEYGIAVLLSNASTSYIYYLNYDGQTSINISTANITWTRIIGSDNTIFAFDKNANLCIINDMQNSVVVNNFIDIDYNDFNILFLQNKILGVFSSTNTSFYIAPLFAYK